MTSILKPQRPVAGLPPPPPPPATTFYPPPPAPPVERNRARAWIIGAVALLSATLLGLGLWGVDQTLLRHDLVDATFTDGPDSFGTGTHGDYSYEVVDGRYEITTRTVPTIYATSLGDFTRIAHAVEASATIASIDPEPNDMTGVGISINSPGDASDQYALVCVIDGCALGRLRGDALEELAQIERFFGYALDEHTLTISVMPELFGDDVRIRGLIDGQEILAATDTEGFRDYGYVGLIWIDQRSGSTAAFDDVVAVVPGK